MKLTQEDIVEIVKLFERSKFDLCQLEVGDFKLTLSNEHSALPTVAPKPAGEAPRSAAAVAPEATTSKPAPAAKPSSNDESGLVAIAAPVIGTFYAAPEPGANPFVELGSSVDKDTTVGLVEVMKVFNAVTAGVRGRIERVAVENEQFVEFGQPLFMVRPE